MDRGMEARALVSATVVQFERVSTVRRPRPAPKPPRKVSKQWNKCTSQNPQKRVLFPNCQSLVARFIKSYQICSVASPVLANLILFRTI